MLTYAGQVSEIRLNGSQRAAWITCPEEAIPEPGQYLSAWSPQDQETALTSVLFPAESDELGFLAAPPVPNSWEPGTSLILRGPLGRGFQIPDTTRRLALVALGDSLSRLLPLGMQAIGRQVGVALFTDCSLPALPAVMESNPLSALPEAFDWADFMALDLPIEQLEKLRQSLGFPAYFHLPCPAQVLVVAPMPCSGLAECGACGVPARRSWKLCCQDGPVFDLEELEW
jgi:NAD(P)H-flavin reductase